MKKIIISLFMLSSLFIGFSSALFAQYDEETYTKDEIYEKINEIINNAGNSLSEQTDSDPYGFQLSVKVAELEGTTVSNVIDAEKVKGYVVAMLAPHNFERFNLEKPLETFSNGGFFYISVGLTPQNAKEETIGIYFQSYTLQENIGGEYYFYTVQISAQFIMESPNDGGIAGDVYYVSKDGNDTPLTDAAFKSSTNEKKVKYRRLGPGDENANSGEPDNEEEGWKPFQGNQSNFDIVDLTPGHYFPSVKINGCIQKFEDPDENKSEEVIIETEGVFNWDYPSDDQTVIMPDGVTATKVTDAEIHTTYSTGNTVEGFLLTDGQNPGKWRDQDYVKKEDVQILKTEVKIVLEPYGWTSNSPDFPRDTMSTDGTYKFENIPSGVYLVYVDGQRGNGKKVEVCNCDENKKPKQANLVYQQNISTEGYEIKLDYKFNYEGETFNLKATWGNVVMAFGDENTVPQKYSLYTEPNKDSLDNPLDVYGNVLQPPFVIIDDEYFYPNCGDDYRYCSDIFHERQIPPIDFSYSKSGEFLSQIKAVPDFAEDGLYNEFQAVEYKKDVVFEDEWGVWVTKGIYFTWQFAFNNSLDNEWPGFGMAASEVYDFYESEGGEIPSSHILGTGTVDARVPDDVIEKIKKGEDFSFTKTDEAATYTLTGTMAEKTTTPSKTEFIKNNGLSASVYPNPTDKDVILQIDKEISGSDKVITYQLYDQRGNRIISNKMAGSQSTIAMNSLTSGIYLLRVLQENTQIRTFKIVKK